MYALRSALVIAIVFALSCDRENTIPANTKETPAVRAQANAPTTSLVYEERLDGAQGLQVTVNDQTVAWDPSVPLEAGSVLQTDAFTRARLRVGVTPIVMSQDTRIRLTESELQFHVEQGEVIVEGESVTPMLVHTPHIQVRAEHAKLSVSVTGNETLITVSRGEAAIVTEGQSQIAYAGQEILAHEKASPNIGWSTQFGESVGWAEVVAPRDEVKFDAMPRGLGKLVGKVPGGEAERELEMVSHNVSARISGNIAYTEIHESFRNPTGETLEGLYRFPLPPDAQISRLSLKVGNTWMEGEFLETARAERIWRDIINQWRDPAILKWKQGNQFELRIFPIDPKAVREVKIGYVQELPAAGEGYRYVYPMPVDTTGMYKSEKFKFEAKIIGVDASAPVSAAGYSAEILRGASEDDQATAIVRYEQPDFIASGDLSIRFARLDQKNIDVRQNDGVMSLWAQRDPSARASELPGYMLAAIRPNLNSDAASQKPRDFVIVADTSYSRRGLVSEVQSELVRRIVEEMDRRDRVTGMACAVRCVPLGQPQFALATNAHAENMAQTLAGMRPVGTHNSIEALEVAVRLLAARGSISAERDAHIILLTDGLASAGYLDPAEIQTRASHLLQQVGARVSVVDFGGDSDPLVLRALASAGQGSVVAIDPAEPRASQALNVLRRHYGTTLTDIELVVPSGLEQVTPPSRTALMGGEELVFAARYGSPVSGDIVVRGKLAGQAYESRFPVQLGMEHIKAHGFVPRAWASHRIAQLEMAEGENTRKEIIDLSIRFGVLSRYTALLALEDKAMMDEFGVKSQKRDDWRGDEVASAVEEDGMELKPASSGRAEIGGGGAKDDSGYDAQPKLKSLPGPMEAPMATRSAGDSAPMKKGMPADNEAAEKSIDLLDSLAMDGKRESRAMRAPPMGRRYVPRRPQPAYTIKTGSLSQSAQQGSSSFERFSNSLERDPDNRTLMMRVIRSLIRAQRIDEAEEWTNRWLEKNSSDPEALAQMAQVLSHYGRFDEALEFLASAVDSAPRGSWIQERLMKAYQAFGHGELACQQELSWNASRGKKATASCELATDLTAFGLAPLRLVNTPISLPYKGSGMEITLEGGGVENMEILVVEPDGRTLSGISARRDIGFRTLPGKKQLSVPNVRDGIWQVCVVRHSSSQPAGGRVISSRPPSVTISVGGQKQTISLQGVTDAVPVAEVTRRTAYNYR